MNDEHRVLQSLTAGQFGTEAEAWKCFDEFIERCQLFKIHREVWGEFIQPRPDTGESKARIDRLLIPTKKLVELGWTAGVIGVEAKRSGLKIGRVVSQAIDYTRCIFKLTVGNPGFLVMPTWICIFPLEKQSGEIASVMAQNRIGNVSIRSWSDQEYLSFQCGGFNVIELRNSEIVTVKNPISGNKRGSR